MYNKEEASWELGVGQCGLQQDQYLFISEVNCCLFFFLGLDTWEFIINYIFFFFWSGMSVVTLHLHPPLSCSRNLYNIIDLVVVFPFSTACFFHPR